MHRLPAFDMWKDQTKFHFVKIDYERVSERIFISIITRKKKHFNIFVIIWLLHDKIFLLIKIVNGKNDIDEWYSRNGEMDQKRFYRWWITTNLILDYVKEIQGTT